MAAYAAAANSRDASAVAPLLADGVVVWFSDGRHVGRAAVANAFEATWRTIADDAYTLSDLSWPARSETVAVCIYDFATSGRVRGEPFAAHGRGTSVLAREAGGWRLVHEHLSLDDPSGA